MMLTFFGGVSEVMGDPQSKPYRFQYQWIGLRANLQEKPWKTQYLMLKSMKSIENPFYETHLHLIGHP
jgi:hypothetical protein